MQLNIMANFMDGKRFFNDFSYVKCNATFGLKIIIKKNIITAALFLFGFPHLHTWFGTFSPQSHFFLIFPAERFFDGVLQTYSNMHFC